MSEEAAAKAMGPAHGEFCWSEIASGDLEKCRPFYENVFGWKFDKSSNSGGEMQYLEFSSSGGEAPDGALYGINPEMFGGEAPPPHIAQYIAVDDVDATLAKAQEIGGKHVFGPYDIPNVGRMAVIKDPTGAAISLITLAPMGAG